MTVKRFIFVGSGIEDNLENESYLCNKDGFQDVCECLNALYEENQSQKQEIEDLKQVLIRCAFDGDLE